MQIEEIRKKILVMDDEDMVGEIACQMLQYLGYDAVRVTNGEEAVLEYAKGKDSGESYSAIIMDLSIPGGMGGREAIVAILAVDPQAKAFVSSGYANDPIMINFRDFGFSGAIAKPFDIATVQQMLCALL